MISGLRFAGLASGLDTEEMMKTVMKPYQIPMDRLIQDRQMLEWKRDDYRAINTQLRSFRDLVFDMKLQKTYTQKTAHLSSNNAFSATATSTAMYGTYTMQVNKLAKSAYLTGGQIENTQYGGGTRLIDLDENLTAQTLEIKVGDDVVFSQKFDPETRSIYDVVAMINNAQSGTNNRVQASYDESTQRIFIMTTDTGESQKLTITSSGEGSADNALTDALKITVTNDAAIAGASYQAGQDAEYVLNGATFTSSTNKFSMHGISFNLKNADQQEVAITVSQDTDAIFDSIVKFVDEYNKLLDTFTNKLYEDRHKDYRPLTDKQREELSEDQIKKWEEKARSGNLRHDPLLSQIHMQFGMTMAGVVDVGGGYVKNGQTVQSNMLSSIGINITVDYMSNKLEINEEKLREAIERDPDGVMDLFTKQADEKGGMGIAAQLYEDVNQAMVKIGNAAGHENNLKIDDSALGEAIKQINKNIERQEARIKMVEERYWKQFTAMEKAIARMNAQSAWLMQQFNPQG